MSRNKNAPTRGAAAKPRPRAQQRGHSQRRRVTTATAGSAETRGRSARRRSLQAARYLWAAVTGLVIAALLLEPTLVWTIGAGIFMIANAELIGLWLLVAGYGMACLPVTFGLLVGTGRFWFSLTHGLWTGAVYSVGGFLFLEQILGFVGSYGLP